jgi:predicted alpha/beta hydrolase family esterase
MFIASTNDSFVNFNHATELYKWANSKVKIL